MCIHTVLSEKEFWASVKQLQGPSEIFDFQGERHGDIDFSLQEDIEAILVPLVGLWEESERWFHNQDFFGDGVRALIFRVGDFPWAAIGQLQSLLTGDAAGFCISVQLCDTLYGPNIQTIGGLAILRGDVVVTNPVRELLLAQAGLDV